MKCLFCTCIVVFDVKESSCPQSISLGTFQDIVPRVRKIQSQNLVSRLFSRTLSIMSQNIPRINHPLQVYSGDQNHQYL